MLCRLPGLGRTATVNIGYVTPVPYAGSWPVYKSASTRRNRINQLGFVILLIAGAIGLYLFLRYIIATGITAPLLSWQRLATRIGPPNHPRFWRAMRGTFPLALLALGISAWLTLATSPDMAQPIAPGPRDDIRWLAEWLALFGMAGCVMRGLHFVVTRTPEAKAQAKRANTRQRTAAKPTRKASAKTPARKKSTTTSPTKATAPAKPRCRSSASKKTQARS